MFRFAFLRVTLEQIKSGIKLKGDDGQKGDDGSEFGYWYLTSLGDLMEKDTERQNCRYHVNLFPYMRIHMMKILIFKCGMLNKWLLGS